jgi:septal ring factor EnvC (AmiA/AmiB activator)
LPAYAEKQATKNDLKNIQKTLEEKRASVEALQKQSKELNQNINKTQNSLIKKAKRTRATQEKLSRTQDELAHLNIEKTTLETDLAEERNTLIKIISVLQKMHHIPPQALILSPHETIETARAANMMRDVMPEIEKKTKVIKDKIVKLEDVKLKTQEKEGEYKALFSTLQSEQAELDKLLSSQKANFKKTESARRKEEAEAKELASKAKNIEELLRKIEERARQAARRTGSSAKNLSRAIPKGLTLPIYGKIVTSFGEKDELDARSAGLTLQGTSGGVVTAPLAGQVKFAGPFQKFRQIVIIEHRDGYHSLIAGLDKIDTVVGARTKAGEPIGRLGANGRLYYELRQNGRPINPEKGLARAR